MIIVDTNVVSEMMATSPHPKVLAFLDSLDTVPHMTAVTVAEIRFGIAVLPRGARKQRLADASERVFTALGPARILSFDEPSAAEYARIAATRRASGRPISQLDAMIAAICVVNRAALVTRNAKDFAKTSIETINPWS